ncbi:hypothetical protein A9Q94_15695 [Rhodobacterales bacterium 56_14_T64]|nr:hypothetical protein A9Q94_15695 [Rhodobacterales bacterium 56_14_T64]
MRISATRKALQLRGKLAPSAPKSVVIFTATALVALLFVSVLLGREFLRHLDDLSSITSDDPQWSTAQVEVENLQLQLAAQRALEGGHLDLVRLKFDILYSRLGDFREGRLYSGLRSTNEGSTVLTRIQGRLDNFAPLIDGPDSALRDALPELTAELVVIALDVRTMSLLTLSTHAQIANARKEGLAHSLQRLGLVVMTLVLALGLTALVIGMLYHRGRVLTATSDAAAARMNAVAARMQAMVTSSLDAILVVDTRGRIMSFNGAAESVFGYSREEATGRKLADLIVSDHQRSEILDAMARFLATGEAQFMEQGRVRLDAKRKSGEVFPVELSITPSHFGYDTVFVSYLRDISDRIAAEAELTNARDNALDGERAKANLLTVMSHEMRTPLNGVLGSMELLETTGMTPEQNSYLHAMRISGELLLHHVNEVLELSQLEAGAASEQPRSFDLEELMHGLVVSQQATARADGNSLKLRCRLNRHRNVQGRPLKIQQVILNLLGNALKFTNNGTVTVKVERQADSELVEFLISDTGVGISAADLERIFEEFVTLDTSYGRTSEGTGLGLAITRRLVGALGGVIEAESELGEGSIFRVTLPLPMAMAMEGQNKTMPTLTETQAPKRLLVVEDNDINRVLMAKTLQRLGHQVTTAAGGGEAVEAAAEGKFDLILMDISMPGVDGTEACRRIRARKLAVGVNIVALTAHAAADDHARILESGFAEVAIKPISRNELVQLISRRSGVKEQSELALGKED